MIETEKYGYYHAINEGTTSAGGFSKGDQMYMDVNVVLCASLYTAWTRKQWRKKSLNRCSLEGRVKTMLCDVC